MIVKKSRVPIHVGISLLLGCVIAALAFLAGELR